MKGSEPVRSAKDSENFPYSAKTVCYIEVDKNGQVTQLPHDSASMTAAYDNAIHHKSTIYAVWPGNYRSDLFIIDDLHALAAAFGVPRPDDHKHTLEWKLNAFDDGKSAYAHIDMILHCGCTLDSNTIRKFARDMKEQRGWDVATSTGISYHTGGGVTEYTIRVRRSSLK